MLITIVSLVLAISPVSCDKQEYPTTTITLMVDGKAITTIEVKGATLTMPADPTKAGHTFVDWYLDSQINTKFYKDAYRTDKNRKSIFIYAKFDKKAFERFNLTFDLKGGVGDFSTQSVESGAKATEPITQPTKDGFRLDGWYTSDNFTTKYVFGQKITADTTIYAKCIQQVALTLTHNNGTSSKTEITWISTHIAVWHNKGPNLSKI